MPKRTDISSILIIGAGPIIIGQASEFDYSGTQACKALREEGYRIVLVNSNPATIMTDPDFADRTYVEPLDVDVLTARREERLQALAGELKGAHPNLAVEVVSLDLEDRDAPADLVETLAGRGITIHTLVNNAGFGLRGTFATLPALLAIGLPANIANATSNVASMPITSPVLRISGPRITSTPGNLLNGNTTSFTDTCFGGVGSTTPSSASDRPAITFAAIFANGTPCALLTNGTVRDARGFTSIT